MTPATPQVLLVDPFDRPLGAAEKIAAHRDGGRLHRAFSIFIVNRRGELLLQRRASGKYHFAGRWSNACCGHPPPGQELLASARRRLREELGIDVPLATVLSFVYRATDPVSGLTEHEFDHVLLGRFDGTPEPDPREADAWRWAGVEALREALAADPDAYAPWLPIALEGLIACGALPPASR